MDEPCSALDPTSTRRIEETIAELARRGDDRDRHAQHAAGGPGLAAGGVLPRRAGRRPATIVESGPTEQLFERPQPTRAPPTTSTAGSGDDRHRARRRRRSAPGGSRCRARIVARLGAARPRLPRRRHRRRHVRAGRSPARSGCSSATSRSRPCATTGCTSSPQTQLESRAQPDRHRGGPASARSRSRSSRWSSRFPLALLFALFITDYAPTRLKCCAGLGVDLMAAVPSIIYGLWGFFLLQPHAIDLSRWLSQHLGWFPFFHVDTDPNAAVWQQSRYTSSAFIAGLAVSMMAIPLACAVMRGGLRPGAARRARGGDGARRDPVGRGANGRAAVRPAAASSAARCWRSAARSARPPPC